MFLHFFLKFFLKIFVKNITGKLTTWKCNYSGEVEFYSAR